MKRKHILAICGILLIAPAMLWAQTSAATMNRIPISGYSELAKMISAPDLKVTIKRYAVARLGELSKDLPSNKNIAPSRLFNPILGVLTPQKGVEGHHVLREEACNVLSLFAELDGAGSLTGPLGRVVKNKNEHYDVRVAAARSLAHFFNHKTGAVDALLVALESDVKAGPGKNNVRVVSAIVASLGRLGDKRAFVPLMRVLQSRFPSSTKRQAQAALESLNWKKKG